MRGFWLRVVVCALFAGLQCSAGHAEGRLLAAAKLQCDATTQPLAVEEVAPQLEWRLAASSNNMRGVGQSAYRVLVASSQKALDAGQGDMWDSGRVASGDSFGVVYGGKPLAAEKTYLWKVMVWDEHGDAAPWSAVARWTMAPTEWTGKWIAQAGATNETAEMPLFRQQFAVKRKLARAMLYVSALGQGEVHLNGSKVGDAELAPSWTDYRKTVRYEAYDVTSMLRQGKNAVGVMVGNGMFNVVKTPKRYTKLVNSFGQPMVMLQIRLTYADGKTETIASDGSWKAAAGPITFSSTYGGEDYDATQEQAGWDSANFKDKGWQAVSVVDGPGGKLESEVAPPIEVMKTYPPVKTTEVKPGVTVYDLGQNFAGWPDIKVRGAKGAVVKMVPGELLNEDGTVSQRSSGSPQWFSYTLKGDGIEEWHPRFSYYGFRYVQVEWTSGKGEVASLTGDAVHTSSQVVGEFASSNEQLNRIHHLIVMAMQNNSVSLFTDCPHREKLGWLEETHLVAPGLIFNSNLQGLFAATEKNMADAQKADGMVPTIAPEYTVFGEHGYGVFDDSPEWGSASVLAEWSAYRAYGDIGELQQSYPVMQRYVKFLESKAKDGIVAYGLGDWYDIGPGGPGLGKQTTLGVTATLMLYQDAVTMAKIAKLLDKPQDAAGYDALASRVGAAFNARFWNAATQQYDKGSQTANAMPLSLGLVPEAQHAAVLEHIVADIHAHNDHVTTGEIGYPYMLRALMAAGRSDVEMAMMMRKDPPSYGSQLEAGATSLTEAWDANPHSSQDHFMLGGAEEWFYRGLGGIDFDLSRPEKAERITIRPAVVDGVDWVRCSYDSKLGKIDSGWKKEGGTLAMDVTIPVGETGTVWVPATNGAAVMEGATSAEKTAGVVFVRRENGAAEYRVASGSYHFTVK
ncbi:MULTISPECIES: family 78 glycoside hydrolase catalytic domain [Acidobacteriaceae]|uniref:family 78 glycoside hydrolase catalytic domain n=1 Tax=Acidobacteriaceae TaxID=204434 RepID=UPI00131DC387|nr:MULTISPECIES: family 78 glycoside hydrolase catalytic domain [Acidobacteriaceae]MDW5267174.1 family 78 glycoside hydrolase catalytic domain [Edaphobacter sp.]